MNGERSATWYRAARRTKERHASLAFTNNHKTGVVDPSPASWLRPEWHVPDCAYLNPIDVPFIRHAQDGVLWAHRLGRTPGNDCRDVTMLFEFAMDRAVARNGKQADPIKLAARRSATAERLRGRLVRQPCERCGAEKAEAHHDDYAKPVDVRWLCRPCHADEHRGEPRPKLDVRRSA